MKMIRANFQIVLHFFCTFFALDFEHKKRVLQDSDLIKNLVVASEFESPTPTMSRWH